MQAADHADRWMDPWLARLRDAAGAMPVLELGCDTGCDTVWLAAQGFGVVATDVSISALELCAAAAPAASCVRHDLRDPFPFDDGSFGAVVASLSLHYFDWATTAAAVSEIRRCVRPGGLLLCRVNSIRDYLHGAGEGEQIEPNYFRQDAHYASFKRFFSSEDLDRLFMRSSWKEVSRQEVTVLRSSAPKVAWELGLVAV